MTEEYIPNIIYWIIIFAICLWILRLLWFKAIGYLFGCPKCRHYKTVELWKDEYDGNMYKKCLHCGYYYYDKDF